jgi:acetyl-CoA C-acetyltransferase
MARTVICSALRTPIGSLGGSLASIDAPKLGAVAIRAAVDRAGTSIGAVEEVIMGNVLTAGVGQAPARQAAIRAGVPERVPSMTINKVCGSGMKAVMLADQAIRAGDRKLVVAGGQESMSTAPYILKDARFGYRLGDDRLVDSMIHDGLTDAYEQVHMGVAADRCAESCSVSRQAQDEFSIESYRRAQRAIDNGWFGEEIVPVTVDSTPGETVVTTDEQPAKADFNKIPHLSPVFSEDGTVTPANASSINDGASALVVAQEEHARNAGMSVMARIVAQAQHSQKPMEFTTAPIEAVHRVLERAHLSIDDIGLFEINEAFAVVALVAAGELGIPREKLNVHGGAVALGHPIGASGARILTTLLHAMTLKDEQYGLAAICIGGGEATAVIVERI